jgi:lipoprotein-releasing system permease protein
MKEERINYLTVDVLLSWCFNSGFKSRLNLFNSDIRHIQRINKWNLDQVGAFEVFVNDFDDLNIGEYSETGSTLDTKTIIEKYSYIFEWLKLFDFNIIVI